MYTHQYGTWNFFPLQMCRAAVLWWNTALPLTKDAPGRSLLAATCQALLEALLAARVRALLPDMHASLFLVLLDCLAEQERWEDGLKWTDLAVRNTAPAQHKKYWAVKTKFMVSFQWGFVGMPSEIACPDSEGSLFVRSQLFLVGFCSYLLRRVTSVVSDLKSWFLVLGPCL
jgi:hypothetical protein